MKVFPLPNSPDPSAVANIDIAKGNDSNRQKPVKYCDEECVGSVDCTQGRENISHLRKGKNNRNVKETNNAVKTYQLIDKGSVCLIF